MQNIFVGWSSKSVEVKCLALFNGRVNNNITFFFFTVLWFLLNINSKDTVLLKGDQVSNEQGAS